MYVAHYMCVADFGVGCIRVYSQGGECITTWSRRERGLGDVYGLLLIGVVVPLFQM